MDDEFKMYLWTQFPNKIIRQFIYRDREFYESGEVVSEEEDNAVASDDDEDGSMFNKIIY